MSFESEPWEPVDTEELRERVDTLKEWCKVMHEQITNLANIILAQNEQIKLLKQMSDQHTKAFEITAEAFVSQAREIQALHLMHQCLILTK